MKILKKKAPGRNAPDGQTMLNFFNGVPVKVFTPDGHYLFTARLQNVVGNTAQLSYLHSPEAGDLIRWTGEPFEVELRGYSKIKYRAIRGRGHVKHILGGIWSLTQITFSDSSDERHDSRLATDFDGAVVFLDRRNLAGSCHVADLSMGGACLLLSRPTAAGEHLSLTAAPLKEAGIEALPCLVCYNRFDDEGRLLCGCRFEELDDETRKNLEALLNRIQEERQQNPKIAKSGKTRV